MLKTGSKSKSQFLTANENMSSAKSELSEESNTKASTSMFSIRSGSRNSLADSEIVNIKYVSFLSFLELPSSYRS